MSDGQSDAPRSEVEPMKECEGIMDLIGPYVHGDLSAERAAEVDGHLGSCPRCREEVAAQMRIAAAIGRQRPTEAERRRILKEVERASADTESGG